MPSAHDRSPSLALPALFYRHGGRVVKILGAKSCAIPQALVVGPDRVASAGPPIESLSRSGGTALATMTTWCQLACRQPYLCGWSRRFNCSPTRSAARAGEIAEDLVLHPRQFGEIELRRFQRAAHRDLHLLLPDRVGHGVAGKPRSAAPTFPPSASTNRPGRPSRRSAS